MEFQQLSDEVVEANYQHKYVIEKYLNHIKNKKVLDAGCWTGPIEKEIVERGIHTELIGIDENERALNVARKNFSEFKFIQCGLTKPPKEFINNYKGYFDTLIFLDVIEHLPKGSEVEVMKFFNKILKQSGVIIISTMASHIFNFIDPAWLFGHRHYKLKSINKMLKEGGFEAVETSQIGNLYWDIDLLLFYIHKHILRKKYQMSKNMYKKIMWGFERPRITTRIYSLVKKVDLGT
jgi:SAM-dependent methyltransferase